MSWYQARRPKSIGQTTRVSAVWSASSSSSSSPAGRIVDRVAHLPTRDSVGDPPLAPFRTGGRTTVWCVRGARNLDQTWRSSRSCRRFATAAQGVLRSEQTGRPFILLGDAPARSREVGVGSHGPLVVRGRRTQRAPARPAAAAAAEDWGPENSSPSGGRRPSEEAGEVKSPAEVKVK